MREIISWEGEEKLKGIFIEKDALTWDDKGIPVVWNYEMDRLPMGRATDIRREPDGSITAEITLTDTEDAVHAGPLLVTGDVGCAMWAHEIVKTVKDGVDHVSHGKIKAVGVVFRYQLAW
ncbi:MAG TPA: hypothetical protein VIJ87_02680 [Pyrinomonadaceae bacterium]|jgi:hypothetical protein